VKVIESAFAGSAGASANMDMISNSFCFIVFCHLR